MTQYAFPLEDTDYLAEQAQLWFAARTSGVFSSDEDLPVTAVGGMQISVGAGIAWMHWARFKGIVYANTDTVNFVIDQADGALSRIDRLVVRYDIINNTVALAVKKGTFAANPVSPAIQRDAQIYEIALADIHIDRGIIELTQADIYDVRLDETVCGVMRDGVTGIPTAQLQTQWNAWLAKIAEVPLDDEIGAWLVARMLRIEEEFAQLGDKFMERPTGTPDQVLNGLGQPVDLVRTTAIVNVTTIPGATVTMTFEDITLTATANAAGLAVLYPYKLGTWATTITTATFTLATTIFVSAIGIFDAVFSTFSNTPWAAINDIVQAGLAPYFFATGDTKLETLSTGEVITIRIEDFNHDNLTAGGKAGMTLGIVNSLNATRQMNSSNTNVGGWGSTAMRTWLSDTLLGQLPSDLQAIIKAVDKVASAGNQSTSLITTSDKIWLFSGAEVGLTNTSYMPAGEGILYPLFVSNASRIKTVAGSAAGWWLRSPGVGGATNFCYVNSSGTLNNNGASNTYGVSPGFCI